MSKHGIHSPFVFDLITKVFPARMENEEEHPVENWRTECLLDHSIIHVTDFGTGESGPRKISFIAKHAAKSPNEGQLLHRIVKHFKPENILELGTSLGISTNYLASACAFKKFVTLEGCPETAKIAAKGLRDQKVEIVTGEFDLTLPLAVRDLRQLDFVFFDGNHREKPTLKYFDTCLPYSQNNSVFIFDDIHWSEEMESAWEKIKVHPSVKLTIDTFHFGIVFFRKEQLEKEHFVVRF